MENERILIEVLKELNELKTRLNKLEEFVNIIGERVEEVSNAVYDLQRRY
jgi:uncharacterized protein YoxC